MNTKFKVGDFVVHPEFGNGLIIEDWEGLDKLLVTFVGDDHWFGDSCTHSLSELSHATLPPAEPTDYEQAVALAKKYHYIDPPLCQRNIKGCTYKRGEQLVAELIANGVMVPTGARYAFEPEKTTNEQ